MNWLRVHQNNENAHDACGRRHTA